MSISSQNMSVMSNTADVMPVKNWKTSIDHLVMLKATLHALH